MILKIFVSGNEMVHKCWKKNIKQIIKMYSFITRLHHCVHIGIGKNFFRGNHLFCSNFLPEMKEKIDNVLFQ